MKCEFAGAWTKDLLYTLHPACFCGGRPPLKCFGSPCVQQSPCSALPADLAHCPATHSPAHTVLLLWCSIAAHQETAAEWFEHAGGLMRMLLQ